MDHAERADVVRMEMTTRVDRKTEIEKISQ
jgi:hypothetical protein